MTARKPATPRAKAAPVPAIEPISTADINVDQRAQSHASLDTEAVSEYAQAMRDGAQFPPLVVFHDGEAYWLAEGFHRLAAAREAGLETIACEVRFGSLRDAILHSAGANATHGLRRSYADKRRAVLLLLEDDEWSTWTDGQVARLCSVSQPFVSSIRRSLTQNVLSEPEPRTYQDRHGNVTQMRTAAIGRRPAKAPAEPAPPADVPAEEPAPATPQDEATNVVALGSRLSPLPTPEAIERTILAEEIAAEFATFEKDGERWVVMRPIVEAMGLDWGTPAQEARR